MSKFTDATGETWTIEISVHEIKQLRVELSVDLLKLMEDGGQMLKDLASDPILLVDVISVLLTEQITRRGLDERAFAGRLVGSGIANALDALIEAIANFFPPQRGAMIRRGWAKAQEMETRAMERLTSHLASADLDRQMDQKIAALLSSAGS